MTSKKMCTRATPPEKPGPLGAALASRSRLGAEEPLQTVGRWKVCGNMQRAGSGETSICYSFLFPVVVLFSRSGMFDSSATLWTVAHQAPPTLAFSKQEYWSGFPCPPPGESPWYGDRTQVSCIAGGFFTAEPPEKPHCSFSCFWKSALCDLTVVADFLTSSWAHLRCSYTSMHSVTPVLLVTHRLLPFHGRLRASVCAGGSSWSDLLSVFGGCGSRQ